MTITITAFERSPDGGKGLARDTRVRWALEEVGTSFPLAWAMPSGSTARSARAT
jgi:glutathione S-transferase